MPENRLESQATMSTLVGGIVNDAQQLIRQEMALARKEIQLEVDKAKEAALSLAIGTFVALLGSVLLGFMLVYLVHWLSNDALPLWGCYGIIGGAFLLLGALLLFAARNRAKSIDLVPPQTAQTMKENVQWIKNQT